MRIAKLDPERTNAGNYSERGLSFIKNELKVLRNSFFRRLFLKRSFERELVEEFSLLYFDSYVVGNTYWLGTPVLKSPLDLWIYQEIITEVRPQTIIECGTAHGGSAHFMATICDLNGIGKVISIDFVESPDRPSHPRLKYLLGSSTSPIVLNEVEMLVGEDGPTMVILDSDHSTEHVLAELQNYSRFVTEGSYLIVEDTNRNGHPAFPDSGPGPMEAVEQFLAESSEFVSDRAREKHLMTFNPKGYLQRVRSGHE